MSPCVQRTWHIVRVEPRLLYSVHPPTCCRKPSIMSGPDRTLTLKSFDEKRVNREKKEKKMVGEKKKKEKKEKPKRKKTNKTKKTQNTKPQPENKKQENHPSIRKQQPARNTQK